MATILHPFIRVARAMQYGRSRLWKLRNNG